ncbi:MAG: 2-oxo acid dehydrogenase subunit E2 [Pseudomonadales bacterium]|nr:2-oxo acid dehydrogenase subunit E2 [Pseudomonadales bacterium]
MGNYIITMPDIGEGIAEVEIVEWNIEVGATIEEDDLLCTVMTDKAAVEIPSPVDGKVTWIGAAVGDFLAVGSDFIRLQVAGEGNADGDSKIESSEAEITTPIKTKVDKVAISADDRAEESEPATAKQAKSISNSANTTSKARPPASMFGAPRPEGEKAIASPAVRQRARNAGVNLNYVRGSGPSNRITHEDLDDFIKGNTAAIPGGPLINTSVKEIKVMGLRRRIAAIMQDTMQRIPHFTYVEEVDVTELESLRAKLNLRRRDDQPKLTMLPFFIKGLVKSLKAYPQMGSHFDDENEVVYQYGGAHIGIATQTPNGLVVPVVKHAEALDIWQCAEEVKRLSEAARNGKSAREELTGSSITISSLGPMGGIATTPVINSPEVAIIGVNKIAKRPVWIDAAFVPRDIMNLSSSFDHRIIDGWEATQFIHHLKDFLESPASLFIEE